MVQLKNPQSEYVASPRLLHHPTQTHRGSRHAEAASSRKLNIACAALKW